MKKKTSLFMVIMTILLFVASSQSEGSASVIVPEDEWSWSRGAYNTFSGQIDLSDCSAGEVTIRMLTDLTYDEDSEQNSKPVFTSVNGKRIVMTKQSNTVLISTDSDHPTMDFTASFRMPEKLHISSVNFVFRVTDKDGNELKTVSERIDSSNNGSDRTESSFYIPVDINLIALILAIAAALVWLAVLIRNRCVGK